MSTSTRADRPQSAPSPPQGVGVGLRSNQRINHMEPTQLRLSPRCCARTRSATSCQSPAMPNGRCRLHGGKSPGAPKGNRHSLKHGRFTAKAIERRRMVSALVRSMRETAEMV
ncbi:HGGxSTG domain-containing protein [Nocardioides sp. NPDC004968]|uniref:HGGxSTG domain-containing protein n=1 Tax=Nocardioides sp. NPDC004968 TaxID=3155894 RepID=UPI0033A6A618